MPAIIVVGAGLSGLTTAKDLLRSGKTVRVLEATGRIGGRAVTDTSFAAPIDLGAAWLHGAGHNPLTAPVDGMDFSRAPSRLDGAVFIGNRRLAPHEQHAFRAALHQSEGAMEKAHNAGLDRPAAEFLPKSSAYRALVGANVGPLESGRTSPRSPAWRRSPSRPTPTISSAKASARSWRASAATCRCSSTRR
ncbi:MAG: FAD-dependent oxidoreductase [Undibacterium sp.]|nr:FAD-dependent oxidoreductase [Opitutaceae bacterium]